MNCWPLRFQELIVDHWPPGVRLDDHRHRTRPNLSLPFATRPSVPCPFTTPCRFHPPPPFVRLPLRPACLPQVPKSMACVSIC
ncbi:hypothetical protein CORC01_09105 [Colletotrichum orchidophilum]|uniref:Uncharacterized protein n=1 Tax=Colletotrichum orchidophilum TaxID=1209926 RepID=A0A1G4B2V8_9PEZI|nr:uncharacterized protein CORC01_09105 [Colletotrichum orchidophilum]OHE95673.1 hypothetical protein CORC01_09105 [Colletotrichum orchidophilum]